MGEVYWDVWVGDKKGWQKETNFSETNGLYKLREK